jgi:hypothetical protein
VDRGQRRRAAGVASRAVVGLAAAVAASTGALASPASADPNGPDEAVSSSVVTRLTLDDSGVGWLTVHPRFASAGYRGFDVFVPAGNGAWSGTARIPVPELGVDCVRDPGPDLHYRCGQTRGDEPAQQMPIGGYQVLFRVSHSGSVAGLRGTSSVYSLVDRGGDGSPDGVGPRNQDTFPVYGPGHFRSTAEVRMVPVSSSDLPEVEAPLSATVTVVPGEKVTAVELGLGSAAWSVTGSNAGRYGLQCSVRRVGTATLHCKPAPGQEAFPAGRFQLAFALRASGPTTPPTGGTSTVALGLEGDAPVDVDDFYWASRSLP